MATLFTEQQPRVLIAQELFLIISTRTSEPNAPYGKERVRRDRIESIAEGPSGTAVLHLTSGRTIWSPSDPRRVETVLAKAHAQFDRVDRTEVDPEDARLTAECAHQRANARRRVVPV